MSGNIDWTMVITKAMKDQLAANLLLASVTADTAARRAKADIAIAPLQDAFDLDEGTEVEIALLKAWKKYRIALNRLPDQVGYPANINWPIAPA